jgi:predicted dehydrogenase
MAERIGVGIIGCGGIAGTHIEALAGLAGDCRVVAVADPLEEAARRRAGKHLLVEKPLALTLEGCQAIGAAVEADGVQLVVGFQARHSPYVRRARQAIPRPRVLIGHMIDPRWGEASWAQHPLTGGGNVLSQGVHTLDLLCHLAGAEPVALHAEGGAMTHDPAASEVIDTVVATLRFAGGAVASLAIGDFGPSPRLDERSSCPRPARSLPREVAAIHEAGHAVVTYLTKGNSRKWASNVTMPVSPSSLASMA